jgi:hypothetical protein
MSKRNITEITELVSFSSLQGVSQASKRIPTPKKIPEQSKKKLAEFFKQPYNFTEGVNRGSASMDDFNGKAKIYSWNTAGRGCLYRGLIIKFLKDIKPDILCMIETKIHTSQKFD